MKNKPLLAVGIIVILLIVAGIVYFIATPRAAAPTSPTATSTTSTTATSTTAAAQNLNQATYTCDSSKTISATFLNSTLPNSSVQLVLSDGRTLTMPQVMSGSGIRYEQGAGTSNDIVFSSEGDNATLTENGTITYNNCVAGTNTSAGAGMESFTDQGNTFTFDYPSTFSISGGGVGYTTGWMVDATTTGLLLVQATLPSSFEPSTNFAGATFTVGTSPDPTAVADCLMLSNGEPDAKSFTVTINGVTYKEFISSEGAAGSFYDTTSYRTVRNNQCYAIEYTVHSGDIGNYPPGSGITAFDETKVDNALESIMQSFKFL